MSPLLPYPFQGLAVWLFHLTVSQNHQKINPSCTIGWPSPQQLFILLFLINLSLCRTWQLKRIFLLVTSLGMWTGFTHLSSVLVLLFLTAVSTLPWRSVTHSAARILGRYWHLQNLSPGPFHDQSPFPLVCSTPSHSCLTGTRNPSEPKLNLSFVLTIVPCEWHHYSLGYRLKSFSFSFAFKI